MASSSLFSVFGEISRKNSFLFFSLIFVRVYSAAHWAALTSTIPSSGLAWWRPASEASHSGPPGAAATVTTTSAVSRVSDGTRPFSVGKYFKNLNLISFNFQRFKNKINIRNFSLIGRLTSRDWAFHLHFFFLKKSKMPSHKETKGGRLNERRLLLTGVVSIKVKMFCSAANCAPKRKVNGLTRASLGH